MYVIGFITTSYKDGSGEDRGGAAGTALDLWEEREDGYRGWIALGASALQRKTAKAGMPGKSGSPRHLAPDGGMIQSA